MSATQKLQITVTAAHARQLRQLVDAGEYGSADEIIGLALDNLGVGLDIPDKLLRAAVDEALVDPAFLTSDDVHVALLTHHEAQVRKLRGSNS